MDYDLFIDTNLDQNSIAQFLYKAAKNVIGNNVIIKEEKHPLGYKYIYIECHYFSIDIDLEDDDDDIEEYKQVILKNHSVEINTRCSVQFISNKFDIGWPKFLEWIGEILKNTNGNLIVIDDSSFPVMKRKNKVLYVNSNLDEYKLKYITKKNLNNLNYPYVENDFFENSEL